MALAVAPMLYLLHILRTEPREAVCNTIIMEVSFAASYGSHMVLQQAPARASVWGFAPSDVTAVSVALAGGSGSHKPMQASLQRFNSSALTWSLLLPAIAATRREDGSAVAYQITASATGKTVTSASIEDVLFGEVWICSGQSNMAFLVEMAFGGRDFVQDANNHPEIRLFTTRKLTAGAPLTELGQLTNKGAWVDGVELPWSVASSVSISQNNGHTPAGANDDNWLYMSAVCYLFGKELQAARKVPVGLMNTNWGGTAIQDWMPAAAMDDCKQSLSAGATSPRVATHLYNAMIAPLRNHTVAGAVWYQGESNSGSPAAYSCQLPAMVRRWREAWGGDTNRTSALPFGVVQLAGDVDEKNPTALPVFRWLGQTQEYGTLPNPNIPNSFLATAHDLGDATSPYGSVHCRNKKEVGQRLALGARRVAYRETGVSAGPVIKSAVMDASKRQLLLTLKASARQARALPDEYIKGPQYDPLTGMTP